MATRTFRAWLDYLAIAVPRHVRQMGYVRELRALRARRNRCREAWRSHLEHTREVVLEAAARCERRRSALVVNHLDWLCGFPGSTSPAWWNRVPGHGPRTPATRRRWSGPPGGISVGGHAAGRKPGLDVGSGAEARDVLPPRRPASCRRLRELSQAGLAGCAGGERGGRGQCDRRRIGGSLRRESARKRGVGELPVVRLDGRPRQRSASRHGATPCARLA